MAFGERRERDAFGRWTRFLAIVALSCLSPVVASAQTWTSLGPAGAYVRQLAIDPVTPSILYAGRVSDIDHPVGGVFKSTDGGHTWNAASAGQPTNSSIYALAMDPVSTSTLYVGMQTGGVYKSIDGGASWGPATTGLRTDVGVWALAINPSTPSTLYAGGVVGAYKSTNGGSTWSAINTGLPANANVYALAIDPLTPSTLYAGLNGAGVYKTIDAGAHWTPANAGMPADTEVTAIAINPLVPSTMYAGIDAIGGVTAGGIFISTNGGATWVTAIGLPSNIGLHAVTIDPVTTSTVYAGVFGGGVYVSTDGGHNFSAANVGLPDPYVHAVAIARTTPTTPYVGACNTGVYVAQTESVVTPTNFVATATSSSRIDLSWNASAGAVGYRIQGCRGATCTALVAVATVTSPATTYGVTGLSPSTPYRFRIQAYNAGGDSPYSNIVTATTTVPAAPPAPTNLLATAVSPTQIDLAWTGSASADGYRVEGCRGTTCTAFMGVASVASPTATFSVTGLTASTAYRFRVFAGNGGGSSPYSNIAQATTLSTTTPPLAPGNVVATAISATRIDLSWTASAGAGGYRIEGCIGSACTTFFPVATVDPSITLYGITGLLPSTTYRFRVLAGNAGGVSPYSNISAATTASP